MLHRFENIKPYLGGKSLQQRQPGAVLGFTEPLIVRTGGRRQLCIYPMNGATREVSPLAKEYGITGNLTSDTYLGPDEDNPYGVQGMFGYKSEEGFRCEPYLDPRHADMAELIYPDGARELLFAVSGPMGFTGFIEEERKSLPFVEPYVNVHLSAIELYRVRKSADGKRPVVERVLSYVHPGWVNGVSIEQWKTPDGINHIICLFAGGDEFVGALAYYDALLLGKKVWSRCSPSIGYLSFFPKGPTLFADEEVARIEDQPGCTKEGPYYVGPRIREIEDEYFGYLEEGKLHPFPSVDLTRWRGDMDYGYRRPPVIEEMPASRNKPYRLLYTARLHEDGMIDITTAVFSSASRWELDPPGTVKLAYLLTPEGEITLPGGSQQLHNIIGPYRRP